MKKRESQEVAAAPLRNLSKYRPRNPYLKREEIKEKGLSRVSFKAYFKNSSEKLQGYEFF